MKKILAIALAVLMVLSLAACGSSNQGNTTTKKGESADILPRNAVSSDVKIPDDFKIGMICASLSFSRLP